MNNVFKDYTTINIDRIQSIVTKVNDMALSCRNITTDKTPVSVIINGMPTRKTTEEAFFINKTNEFRTRLRNGESLDDIMVEALAVVREAIKRRLGMFPYDTQIEAAISMIGNKIDSESRERVIAEMKTGEGKTLVQILVAYLNVLEATKDEDKSKWSSVHVITSNDALAKRDQTANSKVFKLLGITSGFVPSRRSTQNDTLAQININNNKKREAYKCDVVYSTAPAIAFDYLEDNIIYNVKDRFINRKPGFAIVDEADDILIDQAINPLKLSGKPNPNGSEYDKALIRSEEKTRELYKWATNFLYGKTRKKPLVAKVFDQYFVNKNEMFEGSDYKYYKDTKEVVIRERVIKEIGADLGKSLDDIALFNARYYALINCIKAKEGFIADVDYRVDVEGQKAKVVLIDQNIGRKKYSSKYTDGMQEAIEAKEEYLEQESQNAKKRYHIDYSNVNSIRAMYTYPDFMSIYQTHVCGMTGTSDESEFKALYGFDTYRVRTRKRNIRIDTEPEVYATLIEKYNAIIETVRRCTLTGQPVLIGTTSLKESEIISSMLSKNFIRHQLLNANNEEEENQIIEGAGNFGTVTVATNMAGRGTDIKLGPGVIELGGLFVIGTSRNKSSRIDRQLMGRAARQGDPGKTKYYSSLEDDLVRECYMGSALDGLIKIYAGSNKPITNKKIVDCVFNSQMLRESKDKKIRIDNEKFNQSFMSHRKIIYENRNLVLDSDSLGFMTMIKKIITKYVDILVSNYSEDEIDELIGHIINVKSLYTSNKEEYRVNLIKALFKRFEEYFRPNGSKTDPAKISSFVSNTKLKFLYIIDQYWLSHIEYLEDLKSTLTLGAHDDPFKEFETASINAFTKFLIPSIYNEMLTYALNPNLPYGSYKIKELKTEEEKHTL